MSHLIDLSLLIRNREFRLIYAGQFISFIGNMISSVALPYQIYQMTQSSVMVGLLSLVQLLPLLITALIGGVFADRYNRQFMLISSELLLAVGCVLLALNSYQAQPSLALIYIISAAMSAITGLHRPAFDSIIQQIVDPKDFKDVGALAAFKFSFCIIIAPALAGLVIAAYGIVVTYIIDLITFFLSVIALLRMKKVSKPVVEKHESIVNSLKQAMTFALNRQELLGSYLVDIIAMAFAMPNALFPAIAQSLGGATTLGLLYSAPAVGSLVISFFSGWTSKVTHDARAIAIAAMFWGGAVIGFGLSSSLWLILFFLALAGAFDAISGIFRATLWNHTIPTELRGRMAGIEMLSYLSGPKIGDARAGLVASSIGNTMALVSGGVLCIVGVAICCYRLPEFWRYKSRP